MKPNCTFCALANVKCNSKCTTRFLLQTLPDLGIEEFSGVTNLFGIDFVKGIFAKAALFLQSSKQSKKLSFDDELYTVKKSLDWEVEQWLKMRSGGPLQEYVATETALSSLVRGSMADRTDPAFWGGFDEEEEPRNVDQAPDEFPVENLAADLDICCKHINGEKVDAMLKYADGDSRVARKILDSLLWELEQWEADPLKGPFGIYSRLFDNPFPLTQKSKKEEIMDEMEKDIKVLKSAFTRLEDNFNMLKMLELLD